MAIMSEDHESYLCRLKEMILDEQKVVTYVSLSKELCIHVNKSKTLLNDVVKDIKDRDSNLDLNINYIISGLSGGNKACTTICTEQQLSEFKKCLQAVYFWHIYSVSKGTPSVDKAAISLVNKLEDFSLCSGVINNSLCVKRSSSEIFYLKSNNQHLLDEQEISNKSSKKSVHVNKVPLKEDIDIVKNRTDPVSVIKETKSEPSIKKEILSPRKDLTNNINSKVDKKNGNGMQKGIAGFFTKSNSLPSKKSSQIDEPKSKNKVEVIKNTNVVSVKMEIDEEEKKPNKTNTNGAKDNFTNNKKSTRNVVKKQAKVHSNRKRLLHISDSESEDDKNDPFKEDANVENDSDDEIPPTPSVNTVKITSGIINPKKKRKIVDKTYTDDDGYILTRKEEVYESCSDNEVEVITKKEIKTKDVKLNQLKSEISPEKKKPTKKTKHSPPSKGKQATLMNFFKKA